MDFRAYLALEVGLKRRLTASWRTKSRPAYTRIAQCLIDHDWHGATMAVHDLDMTHVADDNAQYIQYVLNACAAFGGRRANKRGTKVLEHRDADRLVQQSVTNLHQYFEHRATALVQSKALQLIAQAERQFRDQQIGVGSTTKNDDQRQLIDPLEPIEPAGPLYVSRRLQNTQDFLTWAHSQGFKTTVPPEDIHVTVVYSRDPVSQFDLPTDTLTLTAFGGFRTVEPLGDQGAVVLKFRSPELLERWGDYRDIGASWDYPEYQPHITITYTDPGLDLSKIEPYTGPLVFGPERMEDLNLDWKDTITEKADRFVTPFVDFTDEGDALVQMASSLHTSRLSTWGFTAEAEQLGVTRYKLTAVLDGRTSPFCKMINGREFAVTDARSLVTEALSAQDPEDLKTIQPWPDQSKAAIAEYEGMTDEELVAEGLNIPPFHPNCRTMCAMIDDQTGEPPPKLEGDQQGNAQAEDFQNVSPEDIQPEQLQQWNDYINQMPEDVLQALFGTAEKQGVDIQSSGDIMMWAAGKAESGSWDIQNVLDPFTSRLYLTQAQFEIQDVQAAADFVGGVISRMISTGESLGLDSIALASGADAAQYAQMGFLPKPADWQEIRLKAIDDLYGDAGSLKPVFDALDDDQKTMILNLLSNPDEHALSVLMDLDISVEGKTLGEWILEGVDTEFVLDLTDDLAVARAKDYLA